MPTCPFAERGCRSVFSLLLSSQWRWRPDKMLSVHSISSFAETGPEVNEFDLSDSHLLEILKGHVTPEQR